MCLNFESSYVQSARLHERLHGSTLILFGDLSLMALEFTWWISEGHKTIKHICNEITESKAGICTAS